MQLKRPTISDGVAFSSNANKRANHQRQVSKFQNGDEETIGREQSSESIGLDRMKNESWARYKSWTVESSAGRKSI